MGTLALKKAQSKVETTFGTPLAATAIWNGVENVSVVMDPANVAQLVWADGTLVPSHHYMQVGEGGTFTISGIAMLDDLPMLFSSSVNNTAGVAGPPAVWTHAAAVASAPTLKSRTFELFDGLTSYRADGCLCMSWAITGGDVNGVVRFESTWRAVKISKQTITAFSTVRTPCPLACGYVKLFIDALGGTMGATEVTDTLIGWRLSWSGGIHYKRFAGGGIQATSYGYNRPQVELVTTLEANAAGVAIADYWLAATGKLVRLKGIQPVANNPYLQLEGPFDPMVIPSLWGDRDGNSTFDIVWKPRYNSAYANYFKAIVATATTTTTYPDA